MTSILKFCIVLLLTVALISCKENQPQEPKKEEETCQKIEMITTKGTIVLELYNQTPKHRDNFIKIVNDGVLDSVLFHRVIDQFMVQAGDPDSKHAKTEDILGNGGLDYKIDAEFNSELFHKRGAIGAARDGNPERASSSTQFYIVQRGPRNDSLINIDQGRINGWLAEHYMQKDSLYMPLFDARNDAIQNQDMDVYRKYADSLKALSESYTKYDKYTIPEAHREIYRTHGGTPHLDQNYTVFGEVIQGMDVVDAIAVATTNDQDRPVEDIRILSVRVLEN